MLHHVLFFAVAFQFAASPDSSWADLLLRARELHQAGSHTDAEQAYLAAAKEAERMRHEAGLARVWKELACLYQDLGKPRLAEPLLMQALSRLNALQESYFLEIASVKHYLGVGFRLQERFDEAERLHREVLAEREKALGSDHGEVAASLHALGMVYVETGQLQEAVRFLERAGRIAERFHGLASPQLADSLQVLAGAYIQLGDIRLAQRKIRRALAIREKVSGPDHVSVGITLNDLARVEFAFGKYRHAMAAWQRAATILERWWGPKHYLAAVAAMHLGNLKRIENRFGEAEEILTRTTSIFAEREQKSLLATSLYYLALVHAGQGKHSQAEPLFRRGLAVSIAALGPDSPHSGICAMGLAISLLALGRAEEADVLHRGGLAIAERAFGPNHPELPLYMEIQASILRKLKYKSEATKFEKQARSLRDSQIGNDLSRLTVDASELKLRSNK